MNMGVCLAELGGCLRAWKGYLLIVLELQQEVMGNRDSNEGSAASSEDSAFGRFAQPAVY